jgi:hypothetical protein
MVRILYKYPEVMEVFGIAGRRRQDYNPAPDPKEATP